MSKEANFFGVSFLIFIFSIITLFISPLINNISNDFSSWGNLNCKFFSDKENNANDLNEIQKMKKLKNLCYRQKAMYNLEYTSFIINLVTGLICMQLGLMLSFKKNDSFKKKIGLFGLISGIICFILTFVYINYNSYIFNNDIAYKTLEYTANGVVTGSNDKRIKKLFSNGAETKREGNRYIYSYQNEIDEDFNIKYKDLGENQYNYNTDYYNIYKSGDPCTVTGDNYYMDNGIRKDCEYIYAPPETNLDNKKLYDSWVTTIVLGSFIFSCNIELALIGFDFYNNNN